MDDPDVLVIGGGVAGLFCAYFLRQAGGSVTVVERGPVGGPQSCSAGNTGFVGTHGAAPLAAPGMFSTLLRPDGPLYVRPRWDAGLVRWLWHFRRAATSRAAFPVLLELKRQSYEILRKLCASGGLADTFAAPGMIVAYRDQDAFERACRTAQVTAERGVPLRILDPGSVAELEPDVELDICGAVYNEEGAYLRVPAFLTELAASLADAGVDVRPHTEVTGFEVAGHAVRRVRTNRGDLRPGQVVLAAGAWSAAVARGLDLGLLLQPIRGHAATVAGVSPRRPVTLGEEQVALAPVGDGLRIGGGRGLVGLDRTTSPDRVAAMLRAAGRYLPALRGATPGAVWSGLRPCSPDSLPFIGRAGRYDNLHVACGHGHIGMGLAPAGGRLLAQLVAGEPPDVDPAPFRVGRYSTEDSHGT
ncbi:MAG TPA: FAD-dependent oxidoreductase [Actinophytocola sp.]|jgi:D-amino-acid dehydrogenase|nr:FAD-dependent oxidoreductase [Actinophytocola sp.]